MLPYGRIVSGESCGRLILIDTSKVFRDILTSPNFSDSETEPILIDSPSFAVGIMVAWLRHQEISRKWTIADVESMMEIWRKYEVPIIRTNLLVILLGTSTKVEPWDIFVVASQLDSPDLAQSAMSRGHPASFGLEQGDMILGMVSQVPIRYHLALTNAAIGTLTDMNRSTLGEDSAQKDLSMDNVARNFMNRLRWLREAEEVEGAS